MNFNSRQSYLLAVLRWSTQHQEAVQRVQAAKLKLKEAHRTYNTAYTAAPKNRWGYPTTSLPMMSVWDAISDLKSAREAIKELLVERAEARVEAHRQVLAARSQGVLSGEPK